MNKINWASIVFSFVHRKCVGKVSCLVACIHAVFLVAASIILRIKTEKKPYI